MIMGDGELNTLETLEDFIQQYKQTCHGWYDDN